MITCIHIYGRRWFDSINGNTYCSYSISVDGEHYCSAGMTYGYGEYYHQAAMARLVAEGIVPAELENVTGDRLKAGTGIIFTRSVGDGLRRELFTDSDVAA